MAEAIWIIIFIPVVMWILSSLVKSGPEEAQGQGGDARKQPSAGDLDRFLEEVNRRRREAAHREPSPPPVVPQVQRRGPTPAAMAKPMPASPPQARPAPPAKRPAPATIVRPVPARPTPARTPAVPMALPVDVPVAMVVPITTAQSPPARPARPAMPKLGDLATLKRKRVASPAVEQLTALLRTPDGLRTAFLVREVLDPPLCKRRK